MMQEDPRVTPSPKRFLSAFAPFPRSTWIHPDAPIDNFDRVCKNIWRLSKEAGWELGRAQRAPARQQNKHFMAPCCKSSHRAEERQKETDDLGLSTQCKGDKQQYHTDFILPCPYLSGRRHPHVAKPARVLSPVMEVEMKRNEGEAKGKRTLQRHMEDRKVITQLFQLCNPAPKPHRLVQAPFCSAAERNTLSLQEKGEPTHPTKLPWDTCKGEDELSTRSSSDSSSSEEDDVATLSRVRTWATDSSDEDSSSDSDNCEEEKNETSHTDELKSDSEQDSPPSSPEMDFPLLSAIKAGILPCPMKPPASGKMHGQWEIPLSFHPHGIPTATLASPMTTQVQAPVRDKAEAPQANLKTDAPPAAAAPSQQEAYDLLADFPALQPPMKPFALGVLREGNPKAKGAERNRGHAHSPNHRQENGASHQRGMENVPREDSSICAGDQKSVLDLQTFGRGNSPTISCEEVKANNPLPPGVAATDGVGVNARSWASAAKAGMKQAAAPQEKARPCAVQQIVAINRAKARHSAAQNFPNKVTPSHQTRRVMVNATQQGPRPRNPNHLGRAGYTHTNQKKKHSAQDKAHGDTFKWLEPRRTEPTVLQDSDVPVFLPNSEHVGSGLTTAGVDNWNSTTNVEGDYRCRNPICVRHKAG